ncbi:MAG: glycosyltransferase family 39 protein [Deltaproteobacteria bacterium]|nr:glycosyltransferase family 39 protein [Deltaproteobacteria bacterium]
MKIFKLANLVSRFLPVILVVAVTRSYLFRPDIQIDEIHWQKRPAAFVRFLEAGDLRKASRFLTHPAFPTNLIFGYGFKLCQLTGVPQLKDKINCGRFINTIIQTGTFMLLQVLLERHFSKAISLIAVLVTASSPMVVGVGSMLHLDSFIGLSVVAATLFILKPYKILNTILSGFCMGLGILTKISAVIFMCTIALSLLIAKKLHSVTTFVLVCILMFHLLPSLWLEGYVYKKYNQTLAALYVLTLAGGFFLSVAQFNSKNKKFWRTNVLILLVLTLIYVFCPHTFQNLVSTFFRIGELASVRHEMSAPALSSTFFVKLTIIELTAIGMAVVFIVKKSFFPLVAHVMAIVLFFVPEKQAVRYLYPSLIILISFGFAYLTQLAFERDRIRATLLFFFALFCHIFLTLLSKECVLEFTSTRVLGKSDFSQNYPSCLVSRALREAKEAFETKTIRFLGFPPLFATVAKRADISINQEAYPYLGNSPVLVTVVDSERKLSQWLKTENLVLLKSYSFGGKVFLKMYQVSEPAFYPVVIHPKQMSKSGVKKHCGKDRCFFFSKDNGLRFYLNLDSNTYIGKLQFTKKTECILKVVSPKVFHTNRFPTDDGLAVEETFIFNVPKKTLVKFILEKGQCGYSHLIIDVYRGS